MISSSTIWFYEEKYNLAFWNKLYIYSFIKNIEQPIEHISDWLKKVILDSINHYWNVNEYLDTFYFMEYNTNFFKQDK